MSVVNLQQHIVIEQALNRHPAVREAVVVSRTSDNMGNHVIAYVVAVDSVPTEILNQYLHSALPDLDLPDQFLFLTAMPYRDSGVIDTDALFNYPLVDKTLVQRWQHDLEKLDGIEQLTVLPVNDVPETGNYHRLEILGGVLAAAPGHSVNSEAVDTDNALTGSSTDLLDDGEKADAVPAIAHGEPLSLDDGAPQTLGEMLEQVAERYPEHGMTYVAANGSEVFQSYPELLNAARLRLTGLSNINLCQGDKVIFQLSDEREFMVSFFACVLGGMIPVPVSIAPAYTSSNAIVQKLVNTWELLEKPVILTADDLADDLHKIQELIADGEPCVRSIDALDTTGNLPEVVIGADDLTLFLLTSGSTGMPKAVTHSHRTLLNRSAAFVKGAKVKSTDIALNWMPLDHVGGIVMCALCYLYGGCSQVHVATQWILEQPLRWLDLIERYRADFSWAPNFAYALVADKADELAQRQWNLSSMRFLLNGGEAVVASTARRFLRLLAPHQLSGDCMYPAWGMSETASGVLHANDFPQTDERAEKPFVEVGEPIPGISVRIVDSDNQVLKEGETGNLQVRGCCLTPGYYHNPEENARAFTDDGWFDTGDAGFIIHGRLTLTARIKDEIIINGVNYPAEEIESVVDAVDGVEITFSVACAVRPPASDTDELAVFFCPEASYQPATGDMLEAIISRVSSIVGITPAYVIPLQKSQIPKTNIGKIQHLQLKRGFESGQFVDELIYAEKQLNKNTLPEWFFEKVWFRKDITNRMDFSGLGLTLIFSDTLGIGEALCEKLRTKESPCVMVTASADYERINDYCYTVNPSESRHYSELIADIQRNGLQVNQIVHLFACQDGQPVEDITELKNAQIQGIFSVRSLVKALSKNHREDSSVKLLAVSSGSLPVLDTDEPDCLHATLSGLLKSAALESGWLQCRHIDIDYKTSEQTNIVSSVECLSDELLASMPDEDIAYRNGQRYTWKLSQVDLSGDLPSEAHSAIEADASFPLVQQGIYLITGGLGGIGAYLAQFLKHRCQAKLILVGRTPLPEREKWPEILKQGGRQAIRIQQFLQIENLGGELIYVPADVSDLHAVKEIVADTEKQWGGRLSGILHLAAGGDVGSQWQDIEKHHLHNESMAAFENMYNSKVYGTWALAQLLHDRPDTQFITFSSVIGLFGGAGFSAYSSAHTFMDAYLHQLQKKHPNSYCFNWSVWEEIGRSEADPVFAKDLYQSSGYFTIPKVSALDCFMAGLLHEQHELIVGLDAGTRNVAKYLTDNLRPAEKLTAFYTLTKAGQNQGNSIQENHPGEKSEQDVKDIFGVQSHCHLVQLEQMPMDDNGEADRQALSSGRFGEHTKQYNRALPETDTEKDISAIWTEILSTSSPDIQDSFFHLGGNSLNATQVLSRIRSLYQITIDMHDIFENATIEKMAALVDERKQQSSSTVEESALSMDPETLLANVENMSDSQVAELLAQLQEQEKGE